MSIILNVRFAFGKMKPNVSTNKIDHKGKSGHLYCSMEYSNNAQYLNEASKITSSTS